MSEEESCESQDIDKDDSKSFEVEAIRAWRYNKRLKCKEYLIKWSGWEETSNTWEPEDHLDCSKIVKKFRKSLKKKEKAFFDAEDPEMLTGFQRNAKFIRIVDINRPHDSDDETTSKVDKQRFYVLIQFDDSDTYEEFTWRECFKNRPKELFALFEARLLCRRRNFY